MLPVGQGETVQEGRDLLFVEFGPIVARAVDAAATLAADGWSIGVINARFAKPLDRQLILDAARGKRLVVTFEESVVSGGFGSAVLELIEEARLADAAYRDVAVRIVGIPEIASWTTGPWQTSVASFGSTCRASSSRCATRSRRSAWLRVVDLRHRPRPRRRAAASMNDIARTLWRHPSAVLLAVQLFGVVLYPFMGDRRRDGR